MKIVNITAFEVIVPAHPGVINSEGLNKPLHKLPVGAKGGWSVQFDQVPKLIIKLTLDNGIIGWGELYRAHNWQMVEDISQLLIGLDLRDLSLQKLPFAFCREYDGFECAIYDAYARSIGVRVVDLLGGPVKEKIKVGAWSSHRHVDDIGELVKGFAKQGYDCVKFKCDMDDDVAAWAREIDQHAPGMKVILDPNERWLTSADARIRIDELQAVGNVLCLEDPLPRWQLNEYERLRGYGNIPIVLHVSLPYVLHGQSKQDAIQAIIAQGVDGFNFNCGLADFQRLDHVASIAGLPCWHGSEIDLGILEAMYLHSAAAAESCTWPSDIFGRMIRSHDLLKKPLYMTPPYAELPQGDGLGIEVDEEMIEQYKIKEVTYQ
ncbi:MAG: mandelate racemase/muconate lactonizing enzyme family protein [Thalassotalea sp.]|nr:mandelate racemase/muconate lactonizing enzyme family protein [Thalassotalea sp.]